MGVLGARCLVHCEKMFCSAQGMFLSFEERADEYGGASCNHMHGRSMHYYGMWPFAAVRCVFGHFCIKSSSSSQITAVVGL
jgi:hypothetical protein